jgi:oxygen-dependent protoporphyrinogen oxidase
MESVDVAVIGAGVSGLSAAYELKQRKRSVVVFDRAMRGGGVVQTDYVDGFVIDAGPDALLVQKPAAVALSNELGLGDRLVPTKLPRTAYIIRNGRLHPLPGASVLGFPTRVLPMLKSTLFTTRGKLRMGAEILMPKRRASRDESIAEFVRRRFGDEAVTYIAEPLLAGIHAGDVERLSMRALFPRLVEAEAKSGSVIRTLRRVKTPPDSQGMFRSFPNGLAELIDALMRAVPSECIRLGSKVTAIEAGDGFTIRVGGAPVLRASAVILAIPGYAAAELLRPIDADLGAACGSISYLSTATVVFALPRDTVRHSLRGTGFVVPRVEGLYITAAAWISSKWPERAPEGQVLLRAFVGGARDRDVLSKTDQELARIAFADMAPILGITGPPKLTRVYRWDRATPQQEVGHLELVQRIDSRLATHPGLFISAAGFRGVGIPDCIADARATAASAAACVRPDQGINR